MPFGLSFSLPPSDLELRLQRSDLVFIQTELQAAFQAFEEDNPGDARSYITHGISCTGTPALFGIPVFIRDKDQNEYTFSLLEYCIYIEDADLCKKCLLKGADPLYQYQDAVHHREGYPSALRQATDTVLAYLENYETRCEEEGKAVKETDSEVAIFAVFSLLFGRAYELLQEGKLSTDQPKKQKEREADYCYALETWNALPLCRYDPPHRAVLEPISEAAEEGEEETTRSRRTSSGASHGGLAAGGEDPPGSDEEKTELPDVPLLSDSELRTPTRPSHPQPCRGVLERIRSALNCCSPGYDSSPSPKQD